jgi:hypothetical protein
VEIDLVSRYNYDEFVPEKFTRWMRFDSSPELGVKGSDYPLWDLDEVETKLSDLWSGITYLVVEFGSFT